MLILVSNYKELQNVLLNVSNFTLKKHTSNSENKLIYTY